MLGTRAKRCGEHGKLARLDGRLPGERRLIMPKQFITADIIRGNVEGCGNTEFAQHRRGVLEIIPLPIVKTDGQQRPGTRTILMLTHRIRNSQRLKVRQQAGKDPAEFLRRHRKPRQGILGSQVCRQDPVKSQYQQGVRGDPGRVAEPEAIKQLGVNIPGQRLQCAHHLLRTLRETLARRADIVPHW